jgi:hypothetical protein
MRDRDVITRLVELHDHIQAPGTSAAEDAVRGERRVRRRRTVSAVVVAAAVVLAVGIAQAWVSDGPRDVQPAPAPSPTVASDPAEESLQDDELFASELRRIVAQVPGWSIADAQELLLSAPCAGSWSSAATGFSGGNFDVRTNGEAGQVWHGRMGFPSAAEASHAIDRLVDNLASCTTVAWQTRPIAGAGSVLASSPDGLAWIHQDGEGVSILEMVTTDGPPPLGVQVEIADLLAEVG